MKIEIYQSGGFAGDRTKIKGPHTENISQEEQEEINQLIIQSGFYMWMGNGQSWIWPFPIANSHLT